MYTIASPWWLQQLFPALCWHMPRNEKKIYLTFDDGPHPVATPFVLHALRAHQAKASFFCIGKNVAQYPQLYQQLLAEGHSVGNHTQNHISGWRHNDDSYFQDIGLAQQHIASNLFRPPYGRLKPGFVGRLKANGWQTIMWDVISADFDIKISPQQCLQNVLRHTKAGSIVVFHDSEKALDRLQFALPQMLQHFAAKDFQFCALPQKTMPA
jgi:peptidoglycan-N-acetylglucosamine deacetylase